MSQNNKNTKTKDKVVSITYEEIGLFPRSFSRVFDRFFKQIFSDVENLVIQEYRFYRYLFLTTIQTIFILLFVPLFVNFIAKTYLIRPITEYFWNTKQTEIFLNSYEQKRAFNELHEFEEKLYFDSLLITNNIYTYQPSPDSVNNQAPSPPTPFGSKAGGTLQKADGIALSSPYPPAPPSHPHLAPPEGEGVKRGGINAIDGSAYTTRLDLIGKSQSATPNNNDAQSLKAKPLKGFGLENTLVEGQNNAVGGVLKEDTGSRSGEELGKWGKKKAFYGPPKGGAHKKPFFDPLSIPSKINVEYKKTSWIMPNYVGPSDKTSPSDTTSPLPPFLPPTPVLPSLSHPPLKGGGSPPSHPHLAPPEGGVKVGQGGGVGSADKGGQGGYGGIAVKKEGARGLSSWLGVELIGAPAILLQERLQEKTLELAIRYNNHSIESITNFFADFLSLMTLLYLLVSLEIQINITKSFLLEVFFGLDDSKKSLLILILTDLLVGYHSSNLWELFFQFLFNHYGIPESQTGIFLLVATLPVLLDVLFKYLIFRHLNRASPATVATYHAIIE